MRAILLVEDQNPFISQTILEGYGFMEVTSVKRGDEAVEAFAAGHFDGVVLDLRLPVLDGWTVLTALKKIDDTIPVVILSAYGDRLSRERAEALGADAFFVKPPDYLKLHSKLMSLIALRRRDTMTFNGGNTEHLAKFRRLMKLKEQAAKTGISTPPEIQIEIEDIEAEMKEWNI